MAQGWRQIQKANKIRDPRKLKVGQKVKVNGKTVTIKKGDTLYGLAGGKAGPIPGKGKTPPARPKATNPGGPRSIGRLPMPPPGARPTGPLSRPIRGGGLEKMPVVRPSRGSAAPTATSTTLGRLPVSAGKVITAADRAAAAKNPPTRQPFVPTKQMLAGGFRGASQTPTAKVSTQPPAKQKNQQKPRRASLPKLPKPPKR